MRFESWKRRKILSHDDGVRSRHHCELRTFPVRSLRRKHVSVYSCRICGVHKVRTWSLFFLLYTSDIGSIAFKHHANSSSFIRGRHNHNSFCLETIRSMHRRDGSAIRWRYRNVLYITLHYNAQLYTIFILQSSHASTINPQPCCVPTTNSN